jgi:hypothetical protein
MGRVLLMERWLNVTAADMSADQPPRCYSFNERHIASVCWRRRECGAASPAMNYCVLCVMFGNVLQSYEVTEGPSLDRVRGMVKEND